MTLQHERLEVYGAAREFVREVHRLLGEAPRRRPDLGDQLNRAAASVVLNIAEGAGAFTPKQKANFYRIAKASAAESAGVLDLMVDVGVVAEREAAAAKQLLDRIVAMLVRLQQSMEARR